MFKETHKNGLVYMTAPHIKTIHAFTTRLGGVSKGIFESLNLGLHRGDREEDVRENYRRLCMALRLSETFVFPKQIHGTNILLAGESDRRTPFETVPYEADGLITDTPSLPLIVFNADCLPILFYDPVRGAVGAVHAGWRGTVGDIAGKAVLKLHHSFGCCPENIRAAIGPGIGPCCFETGSEVPEALIAALGSEAGAFIREKGSEKFMVDLPGANRVLLLRAGLLPENLAVLHECTACNHDKYWSHRHTGGERGNQAAVIMLERRAGICTEKLHLLS